MDKSASVGAGGAPVVAGNVDEILSDLEFDTMDKNEVLDASDEAILETALTLEEAYSEQPTTTASVEPPPATPAAEPKPAKTRAASKPRETRELSAVGAEHFVLSKTAPADLEANKAAVMKERPLQKKIGDKFDNLFLSIAAGKRPSTYTMACFNVLVEKGTATSSDFVGALKASTVGVGKNKGATYNEGTARSQAGQIMVLFSKTGIATREKQTLTINPDSRLVDVLKALPTA